MSLSIGELNRQLVKRIRIMRDGIWHRATCIENDIVKFDNGECIRLSKEEFVLFKNIIEDNKKVS